MKACIRCFKDSELRNLIRKSGEKGGCNYCGARNVPIISLLDLGDMLRDVAAIYDPVDGFGGDPISCAGMAKTNPPAPSLPCWIERLYDRAGSAISKKSFRAKSGLKNVVRMFIRTDIYNCATLISTGDS